MAKGVVVPSGPIGSVDLASAAFSPRQRAERPRLTRRLKDFGRSVTYQVAGLPIAVRGARRRGSSPQSIIRRADAHRYWHPRGIGEASRLALAAVISPFVLVGLEVAFTLKNGGRVARRSGRPVSSQLVDQFRLYLSAGVLPPWYYIFELHRQPRGRFARDFIYRWESKGGVLSLLREGDRAPWSELNDKAEFAEYCRSRQIPAAPVLAVIRNGDVELRGKRVELETDLFVKPLCGRGGKGAERWDYSTGLYRSPGGTWLTHEAMFDRLQRRSRGAPQIVQPRRSNQ